MRAAGGAFGKWLTANPTHPTAIKVNRVLNCKCFFLDESAAARPPGQQPMAYGQPMHGQPMAQGQPLAYGQPVAYSQPAPYPQPAAHAQPPATSV